MSGNHPVLELQQIDPGLHRRLMRIERACLAACGLIAATGILESALPFLKTAAFRFAPISLDSAVAIACCAAGLAPAWSHRRKPGRTIAALLAMATALPGLQLLTIGNSVRGVTGVGQMVDVLFILLAIALGFLRAVQGWTKYLADAALFAAGWIVLSLVFGFLLAAFHVSGASQPEDVAPTVLCALTLLTCVTFLKRAEQGPLSILLGKGIGSRLARAVLPVLLVLPLVREVGRSRMMHRQFFSEEYASGFLSALGTMIGLVLLILLARQIRRLETEIQDLSLRDELTGLYNLRGFQLLARQALRSAQRSQVPFSVLFVDVDNLKSINDELGHAVGSRLLIDTAEFLRAHFRESDVVARIGGDEFALAGNFSPEAIERAEKRLQKQYPREGQTGKRGPDLSLSMGHATTEPDQRESLDALLDRADAAMYEQKRQKKADPVRPQEVVSAAV